MANDIYEFLGDARLNFAEQTYVKDAFVTYEHDLTDPAPACDIADASTRLLDKIKIDRLCRKVEYDYCATDLVRKVFIQHVTEKTLIVVNPSQHPNIDKLLDSQKNVYEICTMQELGLKNKDDIYARLENKLATGQFDNVFIYFIGTICGAGYQFEQDFIDAVISLCRRHHHTVSMLDAVQELFLTDRDYSSYDYILGTAHVFMPRYNLGFLISRNDMPGINPNFKPVNAIKFATIVDYIAHRKKFINGFNEVMKNEFSMMKGKPIYRGIELTYAFNTAQNGVFSLKCAESDKIVFYDFLKHRPIVCNISTAIVDVDENLKPLMIRGTYCLFDEILRKNHISYLYDVQQIFNLMKDLESQYGHW